MRQANFHLPLALPRRSHCFSEDELKAAVRDHLEATGLHRVDIEAVGPQGQFLIEAKGEVALQPQQVNYFVGALGELIQRMEKLPSHGAC